VPVADELIVDGRFIPRDSIVDDAILTERLKIDSVVSYDLEQDGSGKVLALRDLSFQSIPRAGSDGIPTSYPVHVSAGELLDLSKVPTAHRLKEGSDYQTKWTDDERAQLQKTGEDAYLKQFETESPVTGAAVRR
jgi:hypothetical protein